VHDDIWILKVWSLSPRKVFKTNCSNLCIFAHLWLNLSCSKCEIDVIDVTNIILTVLWNYTQCKTQKSSVASLGVEAGRGWADRPGWQHPGWHPNESLNIFCGWIYKNSGQTIVCETMTKKVITFQDKRVTPWHHQLRHRVTPTLVTPLQKLLTICKKILAILLPICNYFRPWHDPRNSYLVS